MSSNISNAQTDDLGRYLDEQLNRIQDKESHLAVQGESLPNSIPAKLRRYYSHRSFRQIILSIISLLGIILAFGGLYSQNLGSCETLAFCSSIILLFAPSPLSIV